MMVRFFLATNLDKFGYIIITIILAPSRSSCYAASYDIRLLDNIPIEG